MGANEFDAHTLFDATEDRLCDSGTVDKPGAMFSGSALVIIDFCDVLDALRVRVGDTSGSLLIFVGVSKLLLRGGCMDLIGLILTPGLLLGATSAAAGAGEDEVLMEDSLDAVCLDKRPARELRERGCCGRFGSCVGIAGTSGMPSL
jgi:hypothetical protein